MRENNPAWEIRCTAFSRGVLLLPHHTSCLCHPWQAKLLTLTDERVKMYHLVGSLSNAALTVQAVMHRIPNITHPPLLGKSQGSGGLCEVPIQWLFSSFYKRIILVNCASSFYLMHCCLPVHFCNSFRERDCRDKRKTTSKNKKKKNCSVYEYV